MRLFRRVLYATDFSRASGPAFATALGWAKQYRAHLTLVHVMAPPALVLEDSYLSAKTFQEMQAAALRQAEDRLNRLRARARKAGVRVATMVRQGVPAEQIVRTAARQRADLVVIGTHGRTGFSRLLLGSVAARVVGLASCPVLTVRSKR
jgi:nucleotide-binding universal stress UspA family protein